MRKTSSRPAYYTPRQVAWFLGAEPAHISGAIRRGTLHTARRRGRLVIPASAITRLLSGHQAAMDQTAAGAAP